MTELSVLGLATAFVAGIVSFLSPCVLPIVPAYVSYVAGDSMQAVQLRPELSARLGALRLSAWFVAGFSLVFIALGASATALGSLLLRYRYEANIAGGAIVIVFGAAMLGLMRQGSWFYRDIRFHLRLRGGRPFAALVLGLAFGFGWTPCIGPVLGAILTVSAASASVSGGIALLAFYALGLGVPFLLAAFYTGELVGRLKVLGRAGRTLHFAAALVMIAMGVAMITGQVTRLGYWLLQTFPVLGGIG